MLERILEQRRPVTFVLTEANSNLELPTSNEWNWVESVLSVLEPFEWATRKLSADKYSTVSLIIPLMSAIILKLNLSMFAMNMANVRTEHERTFVRTVRVRYILIESSS